MKKPKPFIATPTYDGRVHTQYMMSCVEAVLDLKRNELDLYLVPNLASTLLILGRNTLVHEFLKTDATHIMFIDSDIGFEHDAITRLLRADKDVIGGVYPSRKAQTFVYRPCLGADGGFVRDEKIPHLFKADMIPAGFMLVKREVILKIMDHFPELKYSPKTEGAGDQGHLLFNTGIVDGEFWSEDYVFCKRAREVGFEIWIDPRLNFNHAGVIGGMQLLPEVKAFLEKESK